MIRNQSPIGLRRWFWEGLIGIVGITILLACASSRQAVQVAAPSATISLPVITTPSPVTPMIQISSTPTRTATNRPFPSPTSTLTPKPTWTPFKKSLEAYGMVYDINATPNIPPRYSVSWWIWGNTIPATPIEATPQFISYPPPEIPSNTDDLLLEAGCEKPSHYDVSCAQDSPLNAFNCFFITDPKQIYFKPEANFSMIAGCDIRAEDWENPPEGTIYISGCAFKFKQGYIFKVIP